MQTEQTELAGARTQLPAFKVSYQDGTSYVTSMAAGITLEDARRYFAGRWFEMNDEKTMKRVVSVEESDKPTCLHLKTKITDAHRIDLANIYRDLIARFGISAWRRHAGRIVGATHARLGI